MSQIHLYFLDIDVTADSDGWLNYEPFIWMTSATGEYGYASGWDTSGVKMPTDIPVDNVEVDGEDYVSTTSLTTLAANEKYYLWDDEDKRLYVHFDDHKNPWSFDVIKISQPLSIMRSPLSSKEFDGYVDGKVYDPRLSEVPSITNRLDNIYDGQQSYYSTSVSWDNADGKFNLWAIQSEIYGNYATLGYWGGDDIDDFDSADIKIQWAGRIQNSSTGRQITVQLIDARKQFDAPSPQNYVTWTNTGTSGEPVIVPEVWGNECIIPCQCLTPEVPNGANFEFMVGLNSITLSAWSLISQAPTTVYVNGGEVAFANATTTISSIGVRYITIASTVFGTTSYTNLENVTAAIEGFEIGGSYRVKKATEIITYKIEQLYGEPFTATYFDTTNFYTSGLRAAGVSYYLNTEKPFSTIIQELCRADLARFEIGLDGKYRYFIYDTNTVAVKTIYKEELLPENYMPTIFRDPKRAISQFVVGRNRNWSIAADEANAYVYDKYDDNYLDVSRKTGVQKLELFPTPINGTSSDTEKFAEKINDVFGKVYTTFPIVVKQQVAYDVFPGDFINVEMDFIDAAYLGTIRCEVLGKIIQTSDNTCTLELRKT